LVAPAQALCRCAECESVNEGEARFCLNCGSPLAILKFEREILRGLRVDADERREFPLLFRNLGTGLIRLEIEILGDQTEWASLRNHRVTLQSRAENSVLLQVDGARMEPGRQHRLRLRVRSDNLRGRRTDSGAARTWDRWCQEEQVHTIEVDVRRPPRFACNRSSRNLGNLLRMGEQEFDRIFRIGNSGDGNLDLYLESTAPFLRLPRQEFRLGSRQIEDLPAALSLRDLEYGEYEAGILVREQRTHQQVGRLSIRFNLHTTTPDLPVLGVDFGTSTSKLALLGGGEILQIPLNGSTLFPSHVYVHDDGRLEVGEEASRHVGKLGYILNLKSLLSHAGSELPAACRDMPIRVLVKSFLGRLFGMARVSQKFREWVSPDPTPRDVRVVATVPAGCRDTRASEMRQILKELGFEEIQVLVESTAASYLYASEDDRIVEGKRLLVFDCGAGTTDVSVLSVRLEREEAAGYFYRVFDIQSEVGVDIGGNRFDQELYGLVVQKMTADQKEHLNRDLERQRGGLPGGGEDARPSLRLLQEVRRFKEQASARWHEEGDQQFDISCPGIINGPPLKVAGSEITQRLRPILEELEELCYQALQTAGLHVHDIDRVYLVGGSSFLPQVDGLVRKIFGPERMHKDQERLTCVARGAVAAANTRLRRVLAADYVCRLEGGRELDLIRRGAIYPISGSRNLIAPQAPPFLLDFDLQERSPGGDPPIPVGHIRLEVPEVQSKTNRVVVEFKVDDFGDLEARAIYDPEGANIVAEMSLP
jgi:actin-like ATPase involved in cell morphogenesis